MTDIVSSVIREATLDVFASINSFTARDIAWNVSDPSSGDGFGASVAPPFYRNSTKRGEALPVYDTEEKLRAIRDRSRILCHYNEFALGALENRANYVVGCGLTHTARPRDRQDRRQRRLAVKVQDFLELWAELNDLPELEAEWVRRLDEDGEGGVRLFAREDGLSDARFVEPEHLTSPTGGSYDPVYSYGVITSPTDVEDVRGYAVVESPATDPTPTPVPEKEMIWLTRNTKRAAKRGLPTFLPVERNLRRCEELLSSMTSMAKARAKVAIIRKLTGVSQDTAEKLAKSLTRARVTDPNSGEQLNIEGMRDGSILTTNGDYEFPNHSVGASDFVEVLQAELRAVAARLQMPEWMFTCLADAKYSNAFMVEAPTLKAFKRQQRQLVVAVGEGRVGRRKSLLWRAIDIAVEARLLPADVYTDILIESTGPTLEARDKATEATTNKTYADMRVKSLRTIQEELDLDPDTEAHQFAEQDAAGRKAKLGEGVESLLKVQEAYTAGTLSRAAAGATLTTVLGFTHEEAEALLPLVPGVDRTAAGQKPPPQPPGGGYPVPTNPVPTNPVPTNPVPTNPVPSDGNPFASLLEQTGDDWLIARIRMLEQRGGRIRVNGPLTREYRLALREAGFTGTVEAANGVTYYYQDGRRVKNPMGRTLTPDDRHHAKMDSVRLAAVARKALDAFFAQGPDAVTPEQLADLPKALAVLSRDELKWWAGHIVKEKFGEKLRKQEYVDRVAGLFPVPAQLKTSQADPATPVIAPPAQTAAATADRGDSQAELAKLPQSVRGAVERALAGLKDHADGLAQARVADQKFGGGGRYEREANDKGKAKAATYIDRLNEFRTLAASNGVNADAVIAAMGGMPAHEPSPAGRDYRFADESDTPTPAPAGQAPAPAAPAPQSGGSAGQGAADAIPAPATRPASKVGRQRVYAPLKAAMDAHVRELQAKAGNKRLVDLHTPEQQAAYDRFIGQAEPILSGVERDGVQQLGPISDARYAGYVRGAAAALDEYKRLTASGPRS